MKMCLFITKDLLQRPKLKQLMDEMGYKIIVTQTTDEIDQAGKQVSKVILVFDDAKFAYRFLKTNKWEGFAMLRVLYFTRRPIINADASQKLDEVELFHLVEGEEAKLREKIISFESGENDTIGEIEFSINSDLEKKI